MPNKHDLMSLTLLLVGWDPGDPHTWADEFKWLEKHHNGKLELLRLDIIAHGIREPIQLGNDGRVWDGHHRIYIANQLGIKRVPVEHIGEGKQWLKQ